jgi:hypothetical protein
MLSYLPLAQKVIIIGETRFELATSASRTQRSSQAELLPGQRIYDLRFSSTASPTSLPNHKSEMADAGNIRPVRPLGQYYSNSEIRVNCLFSAMKTLRR